MTMGRPVARRAHERGATFFQFLALGVLAAVILGALVTLGIGGTLGHGAQQVVCRVVHPGEAAKGCPAASGTRPVAEPPAGGGHRPDATSRPHPKKPDCGFLGLSCLGKGGQKDDPGGGHHGGCGFLWYKCAVPAATAIAAYGGSHVAATFGGLGKLFTSPYAAARNAVHGDPPWGTGGGRPFTRSDLARVVGAAGELTPDLPPYSWMKKEAENAVRGGTPAPDPRDQARRLLAQTRADGDLSGANARRLLDDVLAMKPKDRTAFLDELSMKELDTLYHSAPKPPSSDRSDLAQYASSKALAGMRIDEPRLAGSANRSNRYIRGGEHLWGPAGPRATDGLQGELADCFCMSVSKANALANPKATMSRIRRNPNGTITFRFGDGKRVTFPSTVPESAAGVHDNALWLAYEEKAMAIRAGGYDKIAHGGYVERTMGWLTGHPPDVYGGPATGHPLPMPAQVAEYAQQNRPMVLGIGKGATIKDTHGHPVQPWHAYTVIGADPATSEISVMDPNTDRIITLRQNTIEHNDQIHLIVG